MAKRQKTESLPPPIWCKEIEDKLTNLIETEKITDKMLEYSYRRYFLTKIRSLQKIISYEKEYVEDITRAIQFLENNDYYNFNIRKKFNNNEIIINGKKFRKQCVNLNWLFKNSILWDENLNIIIDSYVDFYTVDKNYKNDFPDKTLMREDCFYCKLTCCSIIRKIVEVDDRPRLNC